MLISYRLFPSSTITLILVLTLLQCLHFVSSQTTTASASASSSTATSLPLYNFTYPSFPDQYGSGIQVSYKDTIDVSWVANGVQSAPVLQIVCWDRNDSNSFIYYQNPSSYTHTLITSSSSSPSLPSYSLALAPYQKYSPCQLRLQDPHQSDESVNSVGIFISDKTNASTQGVEWNTDDPAPKVAVDAGVAIAKNESAGMGRRVTETVMWAFVGAVVVVTVLL